MSKRLEILKNSLAKKEKQLKLPIMKVDEYIDDQFFATIFNGSKKECEDEKMRIEEERQKNLLEYKRMCPDKCFMNINYKITN